MSDNIQNDSRIEKILHLIMEFASGNLEAKEKQSNHYDELDGIIGGLNMLGEELHASTVTRDFLNNILKTMLDGLIITDSSLSIKEVNPAIEGLLGYEARDLEGKSIEKIFKGHMTLLEHLPEEIIEKEYFAGVETTCLSRDNSEIPVSVSISFMRSHDDQVDNFIFIIHDITESKRREAELRVAAVTFETHDGILITDANARIIRVNKAFQNITGYSSAEVLGKNPNYISSGRHDKAFYEEMWRHLAQKGSWTGEIWNRRKNGEVYPEWMSITGIKDDDQKIVQYVAIFSDITARKIAEEEIRSLAFYDALTGLPNRRLLADRFHIALSQSGRSKNYGAVMFLDLDKFKSLNDTRGHEYGDLLLIEVAQRISASVREMDTVARIGGDEFVILIEEVSADQKMALQKIAAVAEKIRLVLNEPYKLKEFNCYSSPSIGVCLYCGNEKSSSDLLKSADMALYQAKESGRNTIRFFDPLMQEEVESHAAMEINLRNAVENNQLRLHYQIQIDRDGRPVGAEALIRWYEPLHGIIMPLEFIHIAEESSLILVIGEWVIQEACRQIAAWSKDEKKKCMTLAVNVSARQFALPDFVHIIASAINLYKIDPSRLKLELTEHILINNISNAVAKMHELKALGVELSIDDFGTGYSSLSYLKQLPISQLKIDQSFVRDITTDANDAMMVKTIIALGQNFHLHVIAEGVETKEQQTFLIQNGCMASQGFLFGKPVPIDEFDLLFDKMDN
ncbi:MAG: EAL domain-containing protein [Spirochaetia bacterium]|nr:EAL domain-containing protein [Spirochaetia bacterium]